MSNSVESWRVSRIDKEPMILGRRGQIAWYREGDLDVWAKNTRIAKRLEHRLKAKAHYYDGALFIRPPSDLDAACMAIKAYRRRRVSEAMRQHGRDLAARMRSLKQTTRLGGVSTSESLKNG